VTKHAQDKCNTRVLVGGFGVEIGGLLEKDEEGNAGESAGLSGGSFGAGLVFLFLLGLRGEIGAGESGEPRALQR